MSEPEPIAPLPSAGYSRRSADGIEQAVWTLRQLLENVSTVVRGKRREISLVLTALACEGHVLLEDVPGTAKTMLARALAQSVEGAAATRIQCTPDLQPTDVTGLAIFNQKTRTSSSGRARSSPTSCSSTRSTARCRRPSRRCSKPWPRAR